jgi:hypothetical protein
VRDLREQGSVTALAFNDPQRLDEALRDSQPAADGAVPAGRGWNDDD